MGDVVKVDNGNENLPEDDHPSVPIDDGMPELIPEKICFVILKSRE